MYWVGQTWKPSPVSSLMQGTMPDEAIERAVLENLDTRSRTDVRSVHHWDQRLWNSWLRPTVAGREGLHDPGVLQDQVPEGLRSRRRTGSKTEAKPMQSDIGSVFISNKLTRNRWSGRNACWAQTQFLQCIACPKQSRHMNNPSFSPQLSHIPTWPDSPRPSARMNSSRNSCWCWTHSWTGRA